MKSVSAEEVKGAIDSHKDLVLLDVRTAGEYSRGEVAGSINMPVDEVGEKIEKAVPDKNTAVYVYCLSGSRSIVAVSEMEKLGYTNVFDMTSGLLAWRANGYPIE